MAWTELRLINNNMDKGFILLNKENEGDNKVFFGSGSYHHTVRVSQHVEKPLCITSSQGVFAIWEKDAQLLYQLNNGKDTILLVEGVGGTITLTIDKDGKLSASIFK